MKPVSTESVNSTSIRITWVTNETTVGQFYYYNLNCSSSDLTCERNTALNYSGTSGQYILPNLQPDTLYSISVQMCRRQYEEHDCGEIIFTTPTKTLCGGITSI